MGGDNAPMCRVCEDKVETPYHLIMQCEYNENKRLHILGDEDALTEVLSRKVQPLLGWHYMWDRVASV